MSLRFSTVAKRFLKWAEKCRHPVTVDVYRHYFRRFLEESGDCNFATLKPCKVTAWAKTWHQSQAIVRLYRWALEEAGLIDHNPLAYVKHPPKGQRVRLITEKEEKLLFDAAQPDLRDLMNGYKETMARPGELRRAKWGDVFPQTTRAKLRKALVAGRALIVLRDYKNRKERRMPNEPRVILLSPTVGRLLCKLMRKGQTADSHIFLTSRGKPWTPNALRCRMRAIRKKLKWKVDLRGENIVPYTFRHTGATRFTSKGIRDRLLADILGHTETSTTARYQHLCVEDLRAACRKMWRSATKRLIKQVTKRRRSK
jgi:integrase